MDWGKCERVEVEEGEALVRPYCLDDDGSSLGKVRLVIVVHFSRYQVLCCHVKSTDSNCLY